VATFQGRRKNVVFVVLEADRRGPDQGALDLGAAFGRDCHGAKSNAILWIFVGGGVRGSYGGGGLGFGHTFLGLDEGGGNLTWTKESRGGNVHFSRVGDSKVRIKDGPADFLRHDVE